VWIDVSFAHVAARSPTLASLKAIIHKDVDDTVALILNTLERDENTIYARESESRREIRAAWGMIIIAIEYYSGEALERNRMLMRSLGGIREFLTHVKHHFGVDRRLVQQLKDRLHYVPVPNRIQAIALYIKKDVVGWAPYLEGDVDLISLLEKHGDW
jgi:hypothetical protein